jgi:hypothetical protein
MMKRSIEFCITIRWLQTECTTISFGDSYNVNTRYISFTEMYRVI